MGDLLRAHHLGPAREAGLAGRHTSPTTPTHTQCGEAWPCSLTFLSCPIADVTNLAATCRAAAGRSHCCPGPCALSSWCRTGAELKNTVIRACHTWRMPRPPCERRPQGSSVSHSPPGPSFGSLAPVPAPALAARSSLGLPEPRLSGAGPWPPSPTPSHAGGLGDHLAQPHRPRLLVFPGVSPDEGEEAVQPRQQGWGLCCWECAGEWEV